VPPTAVGEPARRSRVEGKHRALRTRAAGLACGMVCLRPGVARETACVHRRGVDILFYKNL
jgi:hypothetical protein